MQAHRALLELVEIIKQLFLLGHQLLGFFLPTLANLTGGVVGIAHPEYLPHVIDEVLLRFGHLL